MLDKKEIGQRIKQIKESHIPPLTLAEFGAKLRNNDGYPIPKGTVDSWGRGFGIPKPEIIEQIALLGNVTMEWIYTGKEMPKLLCDDCKEELLIELNNTLLCPKCKVKFKISKL